jgi:hypothetical protein
MDEDADFEGLLAVTDDYVDVTVGLIERVTPDGYYVMEKDYRVRGEVWRVHKADADPFPSNPHAHCVGGADRFIGLKLHLGTGELYRGSQPIGQRLSPKSFDRLIVLIQPKFPDIRLPLSSDEGGVGDKSEP